MTVVVKKVPNFLRGIVKLIFGIKNWYIRIRKNEKIKDKKRMNLMIHSFFTIP